MAYGIQITGVNESDFGAMVSDIAQGAYLEAASIGGRQTLQDHLAEKSLDPASHRTASGLGATPSGLYRQFHDATTSQVEGNGFLLAINHVAARLRIKGGTIRASGRISKVTGKPIKNLSIPARGESYGRLVGQMGMTLKALYGRNGPYALVAASDYERQIQRGTRRGQLKAAGEDQTATHGRGAILFWLVDKVTQKEDKTVLPKREKLASGIRDSVKAWFAKRYRGGSNG